MHCSFSDVRILIPNRIGLQMKVGIWCVAASALGTPHAVSNPHDAMSSAHSVHGNCSHRATTALIITPESREKRQTLQRPVTVTERLQLLQQQRLQSRLCAYSTTSTSTTGATASTQYWTTGTGKALVLLLVVLVLASNTGGSTGTGTSTVTSQY
jgi:hypothetical protein